MSTPDPAAEPLVDVVHLHKRFGSRVALEDFSLRLTPGVVFGAVGANGGGKTTALRLLAGLLPADAGHGRVLDVDLRAHPARLRTRVGYLTQHDSLYRDLTVTENLLARARIHGVSAPRRRVAELVSQFGLERCAHQRVSQLSGGWSRRVQFAATLAPRPRVLLLDEPTAGLDLETSRHLWEFIAELAAGGTSVLISTHDLVEAGRCDLVGVFVEGTVVAQGTVEAVVQRSAARVVRVPAARRTDPGDWHAALPELAFVRRSARHDDLVCRGAVRPESLAWLEGRGPSAQLVEPTLEDALAIFLHQHRHRPPADENP